MSGFENIGERMELRHLWASQLCFTNLDWWYTNCTSLAWHVTNELNVNVFDPKRRCQSVQYHDTLFSNRKNAETDLIVVQSRNQKSNITNRPHARARQCGLVGTL